MSHSPASSAAAAAPDPANQAWLAARQLSVRRGERRLLAGLDLALHAGDVVWLRGTNGRGKTTLLRLLAGLCTPEEGTVLFQGRPLRGAGGNWNRGPLTLSTGASIRSTLSSSFSRLLAWVERVALARKRSM